MLAAVDPAQPYGAALPWPARPAPTGAGADARAGRLRGAGRRRADRCTWSAAAAGCRRSSGADDPRIEPALEALVEQVRAGRLSGSALEKVDGEPALASPLGPALVGARVPAGAAAADPQRVADARGRHDCLRGASDPPRARGPRARRDPDPAPAARARPLARAAGGPGGDRAWTPTASTCSCASRATSCCTRTWAWSACGACTARAGAGAARRGAPGSCSAPASTRWSSSTGRCSSCMTEGRTRFDQRLAALGPDVLADEFDFDALPDAAARRDDQTRPIGDALLDQRNVAGIGNIWKAEGCWEAGVDPWRPLGSVTDDEARRDRRGDPAADDCARPRSGTRRSSRGCTAARGGRARGAARGSSRAGRATPTGRHTGARDVRARGSPAAGRAQGRRPDRARQHLRELRRRARGRRRHDRVRRSAARSTASG